MSGQTARRKPAPQETAFVGMIRVVERMSYRTNCLLKEQALSGPQYNVLRILRGAGAEGLACQGIKERLIARVPDITRLLDRLESSGHVTRSRGKDNDRRVVMTRITPAGLDALTTLDKPMLSAHKKSFSKLTAAEIGQLNDLLAKLID